MKKWSAGSVKDEMMKNILQLLFFNNTQMTVI
jgi:hypothetical protein